MSTIAQQKPAHTDASGTWYWSAPRHSNDPRTLISERVERQGWTSNPGYADPSYGVGDGQGNAYPPAAQSTPSLEDRFDAMAEQVRERRVNQPDPPAAQSASTADISTTSSTTGTGFELNPPPHNTSAAQSEDDEDDDPFAAALRRLGL